MSTVVAETGTPTPAATEATPACARARSATRPALACRECGHQVALGPHYACPECFGPLEIAYDFPAVTREQIEAGPRNIWRYKALLPVPDDIEQSPNMEPGFTRLLQGAQPRPRRSASTTSGSRTTAPTRRTPSRTGSSPAR